MYSLWWRRTHSYFSPSSFLPGKSCQDDDRMAGKLPATPMYLSELGVVLSHSLILSISHSLHSSGFLRKGARDEPATFKSNQPTVGKKARENPPSQRKGDINIRWNAWFKFQYIFPIYLMGSPYPFSKIWIYFWVTTRYFQTKLYLFCTAMLFTFSWLLE